MFRDLLAVVEKENSVLCPAFSVYRIKELQMKRVDVRPTRDNILQALFGNLRLRNEDIKRFLLYLDQIEPPFSICIDAPWGDGKTFFVKSLELILTARNPNIGEVDETILPDWIINEEAMDTEPCEFVPFYFNAWENDMLANPLGSIVASMAASCGADFTSPNTSRSNKAASVIDSIGGLIGHNPNATSLVSAFSGKQLIAEYERRRTIEDDIEGFVEDVLCGRGEKVVLFIDELDRCRPDYAIRLLGDIKNLFENERLIIVYSTDLRQLTNAVRGFYGEDFSAQKYLERFYDFRFDFTPISRTQYLYETLESNAPSNRYDNIVKELTDAYSETLRGMNRIKPKIDDARKAALRSRNFSYEVMFVECCLLPVFIFMSYEFPTIWKEIDKEEASKYTFSVGRKSPSFMKYLDEAIKSTHGEGIVINDETREEYISDLCALVFLSWKDESTRRSEALGRVGDDIGDYIDGKLLRSLDFPSLE